MVWRQRIIYHIRGNLPKAPIHEYVPVIMPVEPIATDMPIQRILPEPDWRMVPRRFIVRRDEDRDREREERHRSEREARNGPAASADPWMGRHIDFFA